MANPRFDKLSDPELVEICNSGSRRNAAEAFGSLYRRHRDYVTRVALRFCSDREIAADALQETFIYLLRKFPPSGDGLVLTAQLQSLLYPVARNFTLTAVKRQRRSEQTVDLDPDQLPDPRTVDPPHEDLAKAMAGPFDQSPGSAAVAICRRLATERNRRSPGHPARNGQVPSSPCGQSAEEQAQNRVDKFF